LKSLDQSLRSIAWQILEEARFPVVAQPGWCAGVKQRLYYAIRRGCEIIENRRAELPQWLKDTLAILHRTVVDQNQCEYLIPVRPGHEASQGTDLIGCILEERVEVGERFGRAIEGMQQHTREQGSNRQPRKSALRASMVS